MTRFSLISCHYGRGLSDSCQAFFPHSWTRLHVVLRVMHREALSEAWGQVLFLDQVMTTRVREWTPDRKCFDHNSLREGSRNNVKKQA